MAHDNQNHDVENHTAALSAYATPFVLEAHKAFWEGRRCVAGIFKGDSEKAESGHKQVTGREMCARKQPYPLPEGMYEGDE